MNGMHRLLRMGAFVTFVGVVDASPAAAQTGTCRTADSTSVLLKETLEFLVTGTDSTVSESRASLGLPAAAATAVTMVTGGTACRKASDAYRANINEQASRLSGAVYLFQIGTTYAVVDPTYYLMSPRELLFMVFDSRWRLLSKFY